MKTAVSFPILVGRVRSRMSEGASFDDAVAELHEEIGSEPGSLSDWWEALGVTALERMVAPHIQRRVGPANDRSVAVAPRPSWRAAIAENGTGLDMQLPVNGTRKKIRDFTRRDVDEVASLYRGTAEAMTARAEKWRRLGRSLGPEDTIGSALETGKLRIGEVEFVGASVGSLGTGMQGEGVA